MTTTQQHERQRQRQRQREHERQRHDEGGEWFDKFRGLLSIPITVRIVILITFYYTNTVITLMTRPWNDYNNGCNYAAMTRPNLTTPTFPHAFSLTTTVTTAPWQRQLPPIQSRNPKIEHLCSILGFRLLAIILSWVMRDFPPHSPFSTQQGEFLLGVSKICILVTFS